MPVDAVRLLQGCSDHILSHKPTAISFPLGDELEVIRGTASWSTAALTHDHPFRGRGSVVDFPGKPMGHGNFTFADVKATVPRGAHTPGVDAAGILGLEFPQKSVFQ